MKPVTAVECSDNSKLGPVSATYVSQASCPRSCPHYGNGCYAEYGHTSHTTRRLNAAPPLSPRRLALAEARAIRRLSGRRPLRLHVVGDAKTSAAARVLADAAARYPSPVWTYTHAWRTVPRAAWGGVSVLASCEWSDQVHTAKHLGYATALIVPAFRSERLYVQDGLRILPCPAQTRHVTCAQCRLCWDDRRLRSANITIGFAPHGAGRGRVSLTLLSEGGQP